MQPEPPGERLILQLRTIDSRKMFQARQGNRPPHLVNIIGIDFEVLLQDFQNCRWHVVIHFQPDHIRKTPLPDALFNGLHKIAGLKFLDRAVRVPSYMKRMGLKDFHSRKQALQIGHDDLLQPHQVL